MCRERGAVGGELPLLRNKFVWHNGHTFILLVKYTVMMIALQVPTSDTESPPGEPAPEVLADRIWVDGCWDFFHHGPMIALL